MKELLKNILKSIGIYHPLQSFYRGGIGVVINTYYRVSYAKYQGSGYECNFCFAHYERFVPHYPEKTIENAITQNDVIAGFGKNVFCPSCMSKNRERLVLAVLQNKLLVDGKRILHFSPEKHLFKYISTKASVTTVDIMPGFYQFIDKNILQEDATNLGFASESFDMIIANHIMEHIPEDTKAMSEMHRVLKTGGVAILQIPYSEKLDKTIEEPFINNPERQEELYGQRDHVRIYALKDYVARLKSSGFTVNILTPDTLNEFIKHAIQERECVVLCYKK